MLTGWHVNFLMRTRNVGSPIFNANPYFLGGMPQDESGLWDGMGTYRLARDPRVGPVGVPVHLAAAVFFRVRLRG